MSMRKIFVFAIVALVLASSGLWAGDTAVFADLGFSPDGKIYMFGQYGIQSGTLKPWADLYLVDVPKNNFVAGGRFSYVHTASAVAGQDGSGALFRLVGKNAGFIEKCGVDYLFQGQPLYISLENGASGKELIEFRDFESGASFKASLVPYVEGSGADLKSSFYINLEYTAKNGAKKTYTVGTPQLKRPLISLYSIRKVMIAPRDGSMIFVIEMRKQAASGPGYDIRYMVEAIRL